MYVTDPVLTHGTDTSFTPGISERRSGTTTFLHSGLKNADAQSSTAQAITATRTDDAFGMIRSSTGTWRGPFGYTGAFGYQEDASGLRLLGHRYYDASTGRFLTRDPIKDGRNWYAYGAGEANPLTMADPTGLVVRGILRGARLGGFIGLALGGPKGAAVGAVIGGIIGGSIEAGTKYIPRIFPRLVPRKVPAIHPGKQGKHLPGHRNYQPGKSVLRKDPHELIERGAGRGSQVGNVPRGKPGFKERVDYGEIIGDYVDPTTGQPTPTTIGIIVYDKDGKVHIYSGKPKR